LLRSVIPGAPLLESSSNTFGIHGHDAVIGINVGGPVGYNFLSPYTSAAAFLVAHANKASGSHQIVNSTASAAISFPSLSGAGSETFVMGNSTSTGQSFTFMQILEIQAFNRFKSSGELAAIAAQLRAKYAIS
jgi:hypothetical protein